MTAKQVEIAALRERVAELEDAFANAMAANRELGRRCERVEGLEDCIHEWGEQWEIAVCRAEQWKEAARVYRRMARGWAPSHIPFRKLLDKWQSR